MNESLIARLRPQRWDQPFGDDMAGALVDRLLGVAPFAEMEERAFPRSTPLRGILLNDTRVVHYKPGQLVIHEGDYGDSAFLVLNGSLRVALDHLPSEQTGRTTEKRRGKLWRALAQLVPVKNAPESRPVKHATNKAAVEGIFLQDVPAVLGATRTAQLQAGEVFGELSALTRAPRSASVFAEEEAILLEIRWQGLRDLMRYTPALKDHIHRVYRKNSLRVHLRETPMLANLSEESLSRVAEAIEFETFGSFDWRVEDSKHNDPLTRIEREPVIVEEGQPVNDLLLVSSGFARVTVTHGEGHRTLAYLGRGQAFGAEELAVGVMRGEAATWRRSLRAVGYLDTLRLPSEIFVREVLPTLPSTQVSQWVSEEARGIQTQSELSVGSTQARRLDFLVDHRLVNGTEAMVIDLDRCTRCDDCVRACASTHDGNPRFIRQGPTLDQYQYMHACMHCVDPVCMIGCPTGAIHRDEATGIVRINDETCIGCSTCANSCPYSNIQMVEIRDQHEAFILDEATGQPILRATKCDLCVDQMTGPACQNACPHDALVRINLAEPTPLATWTDR